MENNYENINMRELKNTYQKNDKEIKTYIAEFHPCRMPKLKNKLINMIKFQEKIMDLLELKKSLNQIAA